MADEKSLEQLIASASPEIRSCYAEIGGIEQLLAPSDNPLAMIQYATQYGENMRAQAKMAEENRARAARKEKMAAEAEEQRKARLAEDEAAARAEEAMLEAQLRKEYPRMSDESWRDLWPQVRRQHYAEAHERRMHAFRNDGEALGMMRGVDSF